MNKTSVLLLAAWAFTVGSVQARNDTPASVAGSPVPVNTSDSNGLPFGDRKMKNGRCEPEIGSRLSKRPDSMGRCIPSGLVFSSYRNDFTDTGTLGDVSRGLQLDNPAIGR